uniref:Uncharacterized protein n=1 Tax=Kwoniella bestiolae CBS 10118 TaxID=1296100 RepID=A0A1B9FU14_9TREE|nr:hypothetical protein I302_07893 [Kwoniella bestiolae CBS 10118]OCF22248.1 hypothetical protein I302_07893 [Kwoniella bestiolae CBS 10118]
MIYFHPADATASGLSRRENRGLGGQGPVHAGSFWCPNGMTACQLEQNPASYEVSLARMANGTRMTVAYCCEWVSALILRVIWSHAVVVFTVITIPGVGRIRPAQSVQTAQRSRAC